MGAMLKRPFGIILLAGALLIAGLVGMAAFWRVVPRTSNTSPLAALFALIWSCTNLVTATLTWRRSLPQGVSFFFLRSWLSFLSLSSATGIFGGHVSHRPVAAEQVVCHGVFGGAG
jgi:hypothetical protein